MSGPGGGQTGTAVLLRTFLRRDRWLILWFTLGTSLLYWSQGVSVDGLYRTQEEFDRAAAAMEQNAAFIAMTGPARALNTTGGQVAWQSAAFGAILVGLMAMVVVGRHTRGEEEAGREELVRAGVVSRAAPTTAALLAMVIACTVVGVGVAGSLQAYGLPAAGSWVLGVGVTLCGVAFGAVALLAAQLTSSIRAAYGLTGAVIGVSYVLRAIGDVSSGALSWLSPIGWYQGMHAYSGERWWPALLLVGLAAAATGAAYAVFHRRDLGSGLWASRPGPARAAGALLSGVGLSWRLQRGSVYGWTSGMLLGGLGYGSVGDDIQTIMGDSDLARDIFATGGPSLLDSFYAVATVMLVLIAAGFTVASALRPHTEEEAGRTEALLATGLRRRTWFVGHLVVTLAATLLVVLAAGTGIGVGYVLVTGDGSAFGRLLGATFAQLPGLLMLGALTALLVGLVPRVASLAWLVVTFCVVVLIFGAVLDLPQWVIDLSPFTHLAAVPAEPMAWGPFAAVLALAAGSAAVGLVCFLRRDVH